MTTKEPSHTYSMRVLGEELIIRDDDTSEEYSRVIDMELCAGRPDSMPHLIFTYPRVIALIREILEKRLPQVEIEANPASKSIVTATFFVDIVAVVSPTLSINIADRLVIDCAIRTGDPETTTIAKLQSTTIQLRADLARATTQIENLAATSRAQATHIKLLDKMRARERLFGTIPQGLYKFAEAALLGEICGSERIFPAMSDHSIWMSRGSYISIARHILTDTPREIDVAEEMHHWTCLAWIPTVVCVFSCESLLWARMLRKIRASRIIFKPSLTGIIAEEGLFPKTKIAIGPNVRSLVFVANVGQRVHWDGLWFAISEVINPRDDIEVILPTIMQSNIPSGIVVGANVKYESDTSAAVAAPTTWHVESLEADFARSEASLVGFEARIEPI